MRVTQAHLVAKAGIVAKLTGQPVHMYGAYGGWDVHITMNDGGGVSSLMGGCGPAKEASLFLDGMLAALRLTDTTHAS